MAGTLEHAGIDAESEAVAEANGQQASPGRQVRLRINDKEMATRYANAFRSNASHDELMLDFGINTVASGRPPGNDERGGVSGVSGVSGGSEVRFDVHSRTIMNYGTAKRLAMLLGNLVREHEAKFGEIKLNAADRAKAR